MNIGIVISFFIVSLITMGSATNNSVFTVLNTQYSPLSRVGISLFLSIKFLFVLIFITLVCLPILDYFITMTSSLLHVLIGFFLIYYSRSFVKNKIDQAVCQQPTSLVSLIRESWNIHIFSSWASFLFLLIFVYYVKESFLKTTALLVTVDLITALLLATFLLISDFIINISSPRLRYCFRSCFALSLFIIGGFLIYREIYSFF